MAIVRPYNGALVNFLSGLVDSSFISVALLSTNSFTGSEVLFATVSVNELATGNGYTAGGLALPGAAVQSYEVNGARLFGQIVTWTAVGGPITASAAVLYSSDSGQLIAHVDFEGVESAPTGTDFVIAWDPEGIITFEVSA